MSQAESELKPKSGQEPKIFITLEDLLSAPAKTANKEFHKEIYNEYLKPETETFSDLLSDFKIDIEKHNETNNEITELQKDILENYKFPQNNLDHPNVSVPRQIRALSNFDDRKELLLDQRADLKKSAGKVSDELQKLLELSRTKAQMKEVANCISGSHDKELIEYLKTEQTKKTIKENLERIRRSSNIEKPVDNSIVDLESVKIEKSADPMGLNNINDDDAGNSREDQKGANRNIGFTAGDTEGEERQVFSRADKSDGLHVPNSNYKYSDQDTDQIIVTDGADAKAILEDLPVNNNKLIQNSIKPTLTQATPKVDVEKTPVTEMIASKAEVLGKFSGSGVHTKLGEAGQLEIGNIIPEDAHTNNLADIRKKEQNNVGQTNVEQTNPVTNKINEIKASFRGDNETVIPDNKFNPINFFAKDNATKNTTQINEVPVDNSVNIPTPVVENIDAQIAPPATDENIITSTIPQAIDQKIEAQVSPQALEVPVPEVLKQEAPVMAPSAPPTLEAPITKIPKREEMPVITPVVVPEPPAVAIQPEPVVPTNIPEITSTPVDIVPPKPEIISVPEQPKVEPTVAAVVSPEVAPAVAPVAPVQDAAVVPTLEKLADRQPVITKDNNKSVGSTATKLFNAFMGLAGDKNVDSSKVAKAEEARNA